MDRLPPTHAQHSTQSPPRHTRGSMAWVRPRRRPAFDCAHLVSAATRASSQCRNSVGRFFAYARCAERAVRSSTSLGRCVYVTPSARRAWNRGALSPLRGNFPRIRTGATCRHGGRVGQAIWQHGKSGCEDEIGRREGGRQIDSRHLQGQVSTRFRPRGGTRHDWAKLVPASTISLCPMPHFERIWTHVGRVRWPNLCDPDRLWLDIGQHRLGFGHTCARFRPSLAWFWPVLTRIRLRGLPTFRHRTGRIGTSGCPVFGQVARLGPDLARVGSTSPDFDRSSILLVVFGIASFKVGRVRQDLFLSVPLRHGFCPNFAVSVKS